MKISFREESTIDYPGEFGVILFSPICNFNCGFCHNHELINDVENSINLNFLLKELESKARGRWYTAVCISGGEPCLQPGLIEFIKKLKNINLKVKVDTNGSRPDVLKELLDVVDYVAMDIKAPKEKYNEITRVNVDMNKVEESIKLATQFPIYDFRTTVLPFFTKEDIIEMGKWITGLIGTKAKKWTLQQFIPENVKDETYKKMLPTDKEKVKEFAEVLKDYAEEVVVRV